MNTTFKLQTAPFDTTTSLLEECAPPLYSKRVLIFSHAVDADKARITTIIKDALQATVDEIPCLAATILPDLGAGQRLSNDGSAYLIVKDLSEELPSMEALRKEDFPQSKLAANLISPVPSFADPTQDLAACKVQANFIRGGLLLVFSLHHFITDGRANTNVIRLFASNCRMAEQGKLSKTVRPAWRDCDRSAILGAKPPGNVEELHGFYEILPEAPQGMPVYLQNSGVFVSETFHFSKDSLNALKKLASPRQLPHQPCQPTLLNGDSSTHSYTLTNGPTETPWISTHDAVCALFWRTIMLARHQEGILHDDQEPVTCGFPLDCRRLLTPPLPASYVGNAVVCPGAALALKDILDLDDGLRSAAAAIRASIAAVTPAFIENYVSFLHAVGGARMSMNFGRFAGPSIFIVSYHKFDHGRPEDWGSGLGTYEAFCLPGGGHAPGNPVIMPPRADGGWDVSVTLEEGVMEKVKRDGLWRQFVRSMDAEVV